MLLQESQVALTARPAHLRTRDNVDISEGRYRVKLAAGPLEVESALRLRYEVFSVELSDEPRPADPSRLEFDEYDFACRHLIVIDRLTSRTVGTYRLAAIEAVGGVDGFYSYGEFSIEDLPIDVVQNGVEIGRACISPEHRNSRVLFLLWKGLAAFLRNEGKRFFFGCCSIFTRDESVGAVAFARLAGNGHLHETLSVTPRMNAVDLTFASDAAVELPNLFNMYLRIGAKVCGPPMIDHEFGTIDFFVVCDTKRISERYRRMFFGEAKN